MISFIKETVITAFLSLWTRKMRTFLSVLGIIIGILTVSALLTVALGVRKQIEDSIGGLGANILAVVPGDIESGNIASSIGASTLTENDFNLIRSAVPEVSNLSMMTMLSGNVKRNGEEMRGAFILGVSPGMTEVMKLEIKSGRFFNNEDESSEAKVAVVGSGISGKLFGGMPPVGQEIQIRNETFAVVGELDEASFVSNVGGPDMNSMIFMPIRTAWELSDNKQIFRMMMQAPSETRVEETKEKVRQVILQAHGGEEDFSVLTSDDLLEIIGTIINLITAMLSAIAAISLVVGGIGIMNTMLVSVSERTREIGIRKAVGATRGDIMFQFLVESVFLTLLGGILAVIIFSAAIAVAESQSPIPLELDWRVMGGAILFSVLVGVIFGVFPAYKASRKDPIEALRYE